MPPRPLRRPAVLVPLLLVVLLAAGAAVALPAFSSEGPVLRGLPHRELNARTLPLTVVQVDPGGHPTRLLVDGRQVAAGSRAPLVHPLAGLPDGRHVVVAEQDRGFPRGTLTERRVVVVDTVPPALHVDPVPPAGIRQPVTVSGSALGAARVLGPDGHPVPLDPSGHFVLHFPTPPAGAQIVASDAAGNQASVALDVPVRHPGMRGVHMTALAWTAPELRDPILQLAREHKIDTIELDIKDEDGQVGFDSTNPLARQVGAVTGYYSAEKVLAQLHAMHLRVVGRLVAFRDPKLASWAFAHGHKDWVIQTPTGQPYKSAYGGFTNFASPQVRQYNIDLAAEAARLGFDDVLYDYCRRPDGPIARMRFPGLAETPEQAIAGFVGDTRAALRPLGAYVGVSVFGIAADRPTEVAQDVPQLGRYLDFIAPMVYPSHWAAGEYGVADPNAQPGEIVQRSLKVFLKDLAGTQVRVAPWLQDFSLGLPYGVAQVRAQIDAARRDGIDSFLLWDAGARYQGAALDGLPPYGP